MSERITEDELRDFERRAPGPYDWQRTLAEVRRLRGLIKAACAPEWIGSDPTHIESPNRAFEALLAEARAIREER